MTTVHDYNHDLRFEVDHGTKRQQVTSYGDDLDRPPDPKPYVPIDWSNLIERALRDMERRWLYGDPECKGEGLLNSQQPAARDGRWIIDDPGYDPTATPEYQAALRFFSEVARTPLSENVLRDEAAELTATVANQKAEIAALRAKIADQQISRIRDRATMLAEIRIGDVRTWVGQLHDGEFWKQVEIGEVATGYRISTAEAAEFCQDARGEPPAAAPADPRGEAMARAFANDGLLDACGRPRQG